MSIPITDKFKPAGIGGFALVDAADVEMPDGTRLSDWKPGEDTSTEVVILEEQRLEGFTLNNKFGFILNVAPAPFTVAVGENYRVIWDGEEFPVTAEDANSFSEGTILLGNGTQVMLPGNGEPFAIGWSSTGVSFFAFEDPKEFHDIAIYQTVSEPEIPAVTAVDNGKILKVVDGKYALAELMAGVPETVILETQELVFVPTDDTGTLWMTRDEITPKGEMFAGQTYRVVWGNTEYIRTSVEATAEGTTGVLIGNTYFIGGEDTGDPFAVAYANVTSDGATAKVLMTVGNDFGAPAADGIARKVGVYGIEEAASKSYVRSYVEEYISSALEGDY